MKGSVASLILGLVLLSGSSVFSQQPAPAPRTPARGAAPAAAPAPPAPPAANTARDSPYAEIAGGQTVNIRLEVSIMDQAGQAAVQPKVITLLLADRSLSQVRSSFEDRTISIDARPTIVDGKIKVGLTMVSVRAGGSSATLNWNHSLTVFVESGKPLVAVENVDAATNRKLSIEVKATIMK